ncbi:MAG TPA: tetratricopeptide repeat protein, partial [Kofleriaceae bacterium]
MRSRVWIAALCVALGGWEPFRTDDPDVTAGNQAYADGRYDDAIAAYDRAARRGAADADALAYNRGTAELKKAEKLADGTADKQQLTERGLEDLKRAGHAADARIRGQASYNRGNALLQGGKLDDAIDAYKQALREDRTLDDARTNLELALRRREKQQGQRGQQGQGQQGQQGQGQQGQG